jgi:hypothetical protein
MIILLMAIVSRFLEEKYDTRDTELFLAANSWHCYGIRDEYFQGPKFRPNNPKICAEVTH